MRSTAYTALMILAAAAILLQGLWAGLFLGHVGHSGASWLDVHARGGEVAIVVAALATVVAFVRVRPRRDLWFGGAALTVLLIVEAFVGGLIHDQSKDSLTAVHVPLAMAIIALAVWLLVRSRRRRSTASGVVYPAEQTESNQRERTPRP